MRQVIHALLTRPPLSHKIVSPEGNQIKCFVRLACVRHAASVHPEPGSNSHVKSLILSKTRLANILYCFKVVIFRLPFFEISRTFFFYQVLFESFKVISLFNYQGSVADPQLLQIIINRFVCQQLFHFFHRSRSVSCAVEFYNSMLF